MTEEYGKVTGYIALGGNEPVFVECEAYVSKGGDIVINILSEDIQVHLNTIQAVRLKNQVDQAIREAHEIIKGEGF